MKYDLANPVIVLGGGPSLKMDHWRHLLDEMPSAAINHHAELACLKTSMFLQADPPAIADWRTDPVTARNTPGVREENYTPVTVMQDSGCKKFFYDFYSYYAELTQAPSVYFVPLAHKVDCMHVRVGERSFSHKRTCMLMCFRVMHELGFRSVLCAGVDLGGPKHARHRDWLRWVVPTMKRVWGMTIYSLNPANAVDAFETLDCMETQAA